MVFDQFKQQLPDLDPEETSEWIEALDSVAEVSGKLRAQFLLYKILKRARLLHLGLPQTVSTRYINSISPEQEPSFPGDEDMERRIRRLIRWNAAAMVTHANRKSHGLGGHLSTYASAASLYEVGFNHFFRGKDGEQLGDFIFYQGHAAPGIYARAFLEGRLSEELLHNFRREALGPGLSSYPHPRLMPEFWEFPTVSMGLGPLNAVYQARFLKYMHQRGMADTSKSRVWAFLGDGETDEPEALGALSLAAREGLDNLTFVVNCNLQRLDGPVRGNGKIIQELEARFRGAGWNVFKVIWGREWDELLHRDIDGVLVNKMMETLDGDWQRYTTMDGGKIREEFFGSDPRLLKLVEHLSDEQIQRLRRGGHDYRKLYAAYTVATEQAGVPSCVLAKTVKGWTLGEGIESRNVTHQMKEMSEKELRVFRDRLELPIPDDQLASAPLYHPGPKSPEIEYMMERRRSLGGCLPLRRVVPVEIELPKSDLYDEFKEDTGEKVEASTTMAFVRLLRKLMKDKTFGKRIVPIIPDEARTFGMESLFREFKIYSAIGQKYTPVDAEVLLSYTESEQGQLLMEGINEAGSVGSLTAAGTAYASLRQPMIPFYIFYSMFGFQRTGDSIWAFADARGKGFLLGGTAGRTTLNGEGLQHQDGHSHLLASTVPSCRAYDPCFHYETATVIEEGLKRMYEEGQEIFYYITLYNENYRMPPMPEDSKEGIIRGGYLFRKSAKKSKRRVRLAGSGPILRAALSAAEVLEKKHSVAADVYSVTSWTELRREAIEWENDGSPRDSLPWVKQLFGSESTPLVASTDYLRAVPELAGRWIEADFTILGTDGFGRSDTRENLRRFFGVDEQAIVESALAALDRVAAKSSAAY